MKITDILQSSDNFYIFYQNIKDIKDNDLGIDFIQTLFGDTDQTKEIIKFLLDRLEEIFEFELLDYSAEEIEKIYDGISNEKIKETIISELYSNCRIDDEYLAELYDDYWDNKNQY